MELNLQPGMSYTLEFEVSEDKLANVVDPAIAAVFGTPSLVGMMEYASILAVHPGLPAGMSTVGGSIAVEHTAATPLGMKVRVVSTLKAVEKRKLSFEIEAFDEKEKIGSAQHTRFIIDLAKFQSKADAKLAQR